MAEIFWIGREDTKIAIKNKKPRHVKPVPVTLKKREEFSCQYCKRIFSSEKTVIKHLCEQRRRFQQKDAPFARFGFTAFTEINNHISGKNNPKSEEDFRQSALYLACLRWGHFVIDIHCMDAKEYLKWLLKMNIPIDHWNKDEIYDCWLQYWIFLENPWEAFERSIKRITSWAEEFKESYKDYFRKAGTARIITDIRNGAISGWLVFSSESGKEWMTSLNSGELELVWEWLHASRWKVRFEKMNDEFDQINYMNKTIGI
jgi:5-methylcytosine-specific restriction endonuclease McrA